GGTDRAEVDVALAETRAVFVDERVGQFQIGRYAQHAVSVVGAWVRFGVSERYEQVAGRVDARTGWRPQPAFPGNGHLEDCERPAAVESAAHDPTVIRAAVAEQPAVRDIHKTVGDGERTALLEHERAVRRISRAPELHLSGAQI